MTKQLNLSSLLKDMDMLQVERNPLPEHFVAQFDQHTRELYATMLAAIILVDSSVSDNKARLFNMLLTSLKLEGTQAKMFGQAQAIDRDKLRDFCRVCDEHGVGVSFFADALILCRLDNPIADKQSQILSQWVTLLNLSNEDVEVAVYVATATLGLTCKPVTDVSYDFLRFSVWESYTAIPLNLTTLKQGVRLGRWLVDEILHADFNWSIENAQLIFSKDAEIKTSGNFEITIKNSKIKTPKFTFNGLKSINIEHSHIFGEYDEKNEITVFSIKNHDIDGTVILKHLKVNTIGARSFYTNFGKISVHECSFIKCGNPKLIGGALCINNQENTKWSITNSKFNKCYSRLGGAIAACWLSRDTVKNSTFEESLSLYAQNPQQPKLWNDDYTNGGGIFVLHSSERSSIRDSQFTTSNLYLGKASVDDLVVDCKFTDSLCVMTNPSSYAYYAARSPCTFQQGNMKLNSGSDDVNINLLSWMTDFEFEGAGDTAIEPKLNMPNFW